MSNTSKHNSNSEKWNHDFVEVNNIRMHYVSAGSGPMVLLLHGFPEFWYSWRHQIPALSEKFHVVAPDMRGYNKTDKPLKVEDYSANNLIADVAGLIQKLAHDEKKAILVGHDWGGAIAWMVAMFQPQLIERLIILNVGHPGTRNRRDFLDFDQMQRSWYMFFFLLPDIPEEVLSRNDFQIMRKMVFETATRKESFNDDDIENYVAMWKEPGVLTGAINYYRAITNAEYWKNLGKPRDFPPIKAPTLQIWGEDDPFLGKQMIQGTQEFIQAPYRLEFIPNCSHWVQQEAPDEVNKLMLDFLKDY
ncbi:MAG TPA: alpha/beta hydrolase [Thermodesulfobacteriota bacterium]|nr:alpha/beta hydrolase [Thermodesulfobacteriota bacterium]